MAAVLDDSFIDLVCFSELDCSCKPFAEDLAFVECSKSIPFKSSIAGLWMAFSRKGLGSGGVVPKSKSSSSWGSTLAGLTWGLGVEGSSNGGTGCRSLEAPCREATRSGIDSDALSERGKEADPFFCELS